MSVIMACYLTALVVGAFSFAGYADAAEGSLKEKIFHSVFRLCIWSVLVLALISIWSSVK